MLTAGMIVADKRDSSRLAVIMRNPGGTEPRTLAVCALGEPLLGIGECEVFVALGRMVLQLWNHHRVHVDDVAYTGIRVMDMTEAWATDGEVEPGGPAGAELMRRARLPWAELAQACAARQFTNDDPPSRVLVFGGASTVWDDLAMIPEDWADCVIACNRVGTELPRLDHWVTFHPENFEEWESQRVANGHPAEYVKWSRTMPDGKEIVGDPDHFIEAWQGPDSNGASSGGLAAQLGEQLVAEGGEVVLVGITMDKRRHYYTERPWEAFDVYQGALVANRHRFRRVRSMRGWTRDLFGAPSFAGCV